MAELPDQKRPGLPQNRFLKNGFMLFAIFSVVFMWLRKHYTTLNDVPGWVVTVLVSMFLASILLVALGAFLHLSGGDNVINISERVEVFITGFWREAKVPFFIVMICLVVLAGWAVFGF